jgi:hypothetical protein
VLGVQNKNIQTGVPSIRFAPQTATQERRHRHSHAGAHSLIHKFLRLKKIRFFEKIGFLSWCRSQKNPIFSKNRIFKPVLLSKKSDFLKKSDF